jgi:hypothetical protein
MDSKGMIELILYLVYHYKENGARVRIIKNISYKFHLLPIIREIR